MTDREVVKLYESVRARFVEVVGREPITAKDFDTIDAAVARLRAANLI